MTLKLCINIWHCTVPVLVAYIPNERENYGV